METPSVDGVPLRRSLHERFAAGVPVRVGRLLVTTNVALVPLGVGWAALGATLAAGARASDRGGG